MNIIHEYEMFDAVALAELVVRREVSADELLHTALTKVEELNPLLNAVVNLAPDVARRLIHEGLPLGPLRGVPFLLKDLGAEAIDFPSHNGSRLLADTRYTRNSTLYERLRDSGLVTFGRTTAPEGGVGPVTEAAVYAGPTRNPWNLEYTPGGSSGGAGASVAAGIVPAAHGSDGGGSVRIPASCCGLFGVKPTRARLPDGPYVGEGWAGMAIDGFLTRSVRDNATLLDVTQGPDHGAPYRAPPLKRSFRDALQTNPGILKIGFTAESFTGRPIDPECAAAVESAAHLLEDLGHVVEEATPNADIQRMMHDWTIIVACGTASWVRSRARSRGRPVEDSELEPVARAACRYAETLQGADYLDAVHGIHSFGRAYARFFDTYDVLLTSVLAEPPAKIGRFHHQSDDFLAYRLGEAGVFPYSPFAAVYNATGQPAASLPLHWAPNGLPVGVQLATGFGEDELLISLCARLEEARPWFHRRPPLTGKVPSSPNSFIERPS